MDSNVLGVIIVIVMFALGMITKDELQKRKRVKETVKQAEQAEGESTHAATQQYDKALEQAEHEITDEMDSRPTTSDPIADLADRIRRHRDRKHASRQRDSAG